MSKIYGYSIYILDTDDEDENEVPDCGFVFAENTKEAFDKVYNDHTSSTEEITSIRIAELDPEEYKDTFSVYMFLSDWNINKTALEYQLKKWFLL